MALQNKRDIMNKKSIIIENFCNNIKELVKVANNLMPNNEDLMLIKRGVRIITSSIGNVLVEELGPEIFEYHKEIEDEDFSFVPKIDFNKRIDDKKELILHHQNRSHNGNSEIESYKSILQMVLQVYYKCSQIEQKKIHDIIRDLLKEYIKYLIHEKTYG